MEIYRARIVLGVVLISMLIAVLDSTDYRAWRKDRKPRIFGNRVPLNTVMTSYNKVRRKIVLYHNFFRTKVDPPAANMLRMSWHAGAARDAQYWAERCRFLTHDPAESRRQPRYNECGQNIFVASKRVPWFFATKSWFLERENFTYGSPHNSLRDVGHYTQLVWASSHRLGCGYAHCPHGGPRGQPFHNYVCNYCPAGNWDAKTSTPYKAGPSCGRCPRHCSSRALCTNACARADLWSNCVELARSVGKRRLCGQHNNDCAATCNCPDRIHEWMV